MFFFHVRPKRRIVEKNRRAGRATKLQRGYQSRDILTVIARRRNSSWKKSYPERSHSQHLPEKSMEKFESTWLLSRARVVYFTNTRWMHFNLNARRILLLPLFFSFSFFSFFFIATGTSLHKRDRQDADDREASSQDDWKVNVGHGVSSAFPLKFMASVQQEFNLNVSIFF